MVGQELTWQRETSEKREEKNPWLPMISERQGMTRESHVGVRMEKIIEVNDGSLEKQEVQLVSVVDSMLFEYRIRSMN